MPGFAAADSEEVVLCVRDPRPSASEAIAQLLLPWCVVPKDVDNAEVILTFGTDRRGFPTTIVIMAESIDRSGRSTGLSSCRAKGGCVALPLDVVAEYQRAISYVMHPRVSVVYRTITSLPVRYSVIPGGIRSALLRRKGISPGEWSRRLHLDTLRNMLKHAIEKVMGRQLRERHWNQKRYACLMTHDVETRNGMKKARSLLKVEERYDVSSTWFLPAHFLPIGNAVAMEFIRRGEVAPHGVLHDGKLAMATSEKVLASVLKAKELFASRAGLKVQGFRAPLLQHNATILRSLATSGYEWDSSVPTWEPLHPVTMTPHGLGTVYPLRLGGLVEIPVTLPQDHQMIHVLGLTPRETKKEWMNMINTIKQSHGMVVISVHPDYDFSDRSNLAEYEGLIAEVHSDREAWITTPTELVDCLYSASTHRSQTLSERSRI